MALEIGGVIDNFIYYVKTDEYIVTKPKKEQNSMEVSLTGVGRLNAFSDIEFQYNNYEKYPVITLESASERLTHIYIDDEIIDENVSIRTQYADKTTLTEGIRKMAQAVRTNVLETVDNDVVLKRIKDTAPVAYIGVENMFNSPEIQKIEKPKTVEVKTYIPKITKTNQVLVDQEFVHENKKYHFNYNEKHTAQPYSGKLYYIKFGDLDLDPEGFNIDIASSTTFLDNRAIFNGYGTTGDTVRIEMKGNVVEITNSSVNFNLDNLSTEVKTIDNESIDNNEQAKLIYEWIYGNILKEFEYKVELQDTFTYELGDTVLIESNIYVNGIMIVRPAIITKIEKEYKGALHYTLTLRGE